MTTPDIPAFEPDVSLMCDDPFEGFHCTRALDHAGDHVAHGGHPLRVLCSWPRLRLADVLGTDGFLPGPPSSLHDAVLADALAEITESAASWKETLRRQVRAAKEIEAAWHDPHWLDGH